MRADLQRVGSGDETSVYVHVAIRRPRAHQAIAHVQASVELACAHKLGKDCQCLPPVNSNKCSSPNKVELWSSQGVFEAD